MERSRPPAAPDGPVRPALRPAAGGSRAARVLNGKGMAHGAGPAGGSDPGTGPIDLRDPHLARAVPVAFLNRDGTASIFHMSGWVATR